MMQTTGKIYLIGLLRVLYTSKLIYTKCLEEYLIHSKCSVSLTYTYYCILLVTRKVKSLQKKKKKVPKLRINNSSRKLRNLLRAIARMW